MYPIGSQTYDQNDSTATEEISLKALINNPASRVHVEGSKHLCIISAIYVITRWRLGTIDDLHHRAAKSQQRNRRRERA